MLYPLPSLPLPAPPSPGTRSAHSGDAVVDGFDSLLESAEQGYWIAHHDAPDAVPIGLLHPAPATNTTTTDTTTMDTAATPTAAEERAERERETEGEVRALEAAPVKQEKDVHEGEMLRDSRVLVQSTAAFMTPPPVETSHAPPVQNSAQARAQKHESELHAKATQAQRVKLEEDADENEISRGIQNGTAYPDATTPAPSAAPPSVQTREPARAQEHETALHATVTQAPRVKREEDANGNEVLHGVHASTASTALQPVGTTAPSAALPTTRTPKRRAAPSPAQGRARKRVARDENDAENAQNAPPRTPKRPRTDENENAPPRTPKRPRTDEHENANARADGSPRVQPGALGVLLVRLDVQRMRHPRRGVRVPLGHAPQPAPFAPYNRSHPAAMYDAAAGRARVFAPLDAPLNAALNAPLNAALDAAPADAAPHRRAARRAADAPLTRAALASLVAAPPTVGDVEAWRRGVAAAVGGSGADAVGGGVADAAAGDGEREGEGDGGEEGGDGVDWDGETAVEECPEEEGAFAAYVRRAEGVWGWEWE